MIETTPSPFWTSTDKSLSKHDIEWWQHELKALFNLIGITGVTNEDDKSLKALFLSKMSGLALGLVGHCANGVV